jgi:hypothetical protein
MFVGNRCRHLHRITYGVFNLQLFGVVFNRWMLVDVGGFVRRNRLMFIR